MDIRTKVNARGAVVLKMYDKNGNLFQTYEAQNLVVATGQQAAAHLLGGDTAGRSVDRFAVGTSGDPAVPSDTGLAEAFTKAISSVSYPANGVQFSFSLELAEANGLTIREFGLLCADNSLFSRLVRAPIVKDNTVRIEGTWTIQF